MESNALRASTRLGITRYQQEKSLWCWAAAVQIVAKYETGRKVSQSSIVKHVKGNVLNQTGTNVNQVDALKYIDSDAFADADYWSANTLSKFEKRVQKNYDKGHATILSCVGNNYGHSLVVENSKNAVVELVDPWEDVENWVYTKEKLINDGVKCKAVNDYVTISSCVIY